LAQKWLSITLQLVLAVTSAAAWPASARSSLWERLFPSTPRLGSLLLLTLAVLLVGGLNRLVGAG